MGRAHKKAHVADQPNGDFFRQVRGKIWNDRWFRRLSGAGKALWLFLLTSPQSTPCGVYVIDRDMLPVYLHGFTQDEINAAWDEVFDGEHAHADDHPNGTSVFVVKMRFYQKASGLQHDKHARACLRDLATPEIRALFLAKYPIDGVGDGVGDGVSHGVGDGVGDGVWDTPSRERREKREGGAPPPPVTPPGRPSRARARARARTRTGARGGFPTKADVDAACDMVWRGYEWWRGWVTQEAKRRDGDQEMRDDGTFPPAIEPRRWRAHARILKEHRKAIRTILVEEAKSLDEFRDQLKALFKHMQDREFYFLRPTPSRPGEKIDKKDDWEGSLMTILRPTKWEARVDSGRGAA